MSKVDIELEDGERSVGQVAYEAYCEYVDWKSVKGEKLPQWDKVQSSIKEAWEAAGEAVAEVYNDE